MNFPTGEYHIEKDYLPKLNNMCTIHYTLKNKFSFVVWYASGNILVLIVLSQFLVFFLPDTSLQTTLECAVPLSIVTLMALKNKIYYYRSDKIRSLKQYINRHFWPISFAGDVAFEAHVKRELRILEYICRYHLTSTFFSVVYYCYYPMMTYEEGELEYPLKVWLPYDDSPKWRHYTTRGLMTLAVYLGLVILIAFDFLFVYYVAHTSVQFKILRKMLQNINAVEGYDTGDLSLIQNAKYQAIINSRINICIDHHARLLWFGNEIQSFFSVPLALQLFFSLGCLCLSGFEIIEERRIYRKFKWAWYFVGIVTELVLYCLPGSYLEYQSEKLLPTCYQSQWYLSDVRLRKKLVLLQKIALERVVNISAFGVVPVDNITLLQLFKISFSCITLLQAVNEGTA